MKPVSGRAGSHDVPRARLKPSVLKNLPIFDGCRPYVSQVRSEILTRTRHQSRHLDHLFLYIDQGRGIYQIGEEIFALKSGDAVILPPVTLQTIHKEPGLELKHSVVHFYIPERHSLQHPVVFQNLSPLTTDLVNSKLSHLSRRFKEVQKDSLHLGKDFLEMLTVCLCPDSRSPGPGRRSGHKPT